MTDTFQDRLIRSKCWLPWTPSVAEADGNLWEICVGCTRAIGSLSRVLYLFWSSIWPGIVFLKKDSCLCNSSLLLFKHNCIYFSLRNSNQWLSVRVNRVSSANTLKCEIRILLSWFNGTSHTVRTISGNKHIVCHVQPSSHRLVVHFAADYGPFWTQAQAQLWDTI
jgi:hypothetical protein